MSPEFTKLAKNTVFQYVYQMLDGINTEHRNPKNHHHIDGLVP